MPAVIAVPAHRRHDISDQVWEILEPLLPGGKGKTGRPAQDNRRFINAVFWILRTGVPWRDLPPDYGDWKNTHRRFCRWRDRGVWAMLLEALIDDPDFEWLMIDASYIKAHPHSAGARGRQPGYRPHKRGLNSKLHLAVDAHGMPVRVMVTEGTAADCSQALPLIEGIDAECLLADRAYDTNEIIAAATKSGMEPVIPPKSNRRRSGSMTGRCTSCGTWWKMASWTSSSGVEWQPGMPKTPFLTWPSARFGRWPFGPNCFDDRP